MGDVSRVGRPAVCHEITNGCPLPEVAEVEIMSCGADYLSGLPKGRAQLVHSAIVVC
jgi:hypothetical protein